MTVAVEMSACTSSCARSRQQQQWQQQEQQQQHQARVEARVDMRNGTTACNKLYMATRDNCLTSARFSLLPRDLQRNNGTLDIRVLLDHNVLQVFFAGDHETRFAFSLIFLDS